MWRPEDVALTIAKPQAADGFMTTA